jgi:YebC/PmpR family DNA-binding regulatory protein
LAGHSKFANIKHRKDAQDKKKGKIFTKLIKEITVAVKVGGGDPESNPRLRIALQNARGANMPKDNIAKAIAKATGAGSLNYQEFTFEGYGPLGTAVFIECASDNHTRTVANIRSYFRKCDGDLGKDGCLEFIFQRRGFFIIEKSLIKESEEDFILKMMDFGVEDVEYHDNTATLTCPMEEFGGLSKALSDMGIEAIESGLRRFPLMFKKIEDSDSLTKFNKLIDTIEEDDDVQNVFHNVDL